MADSGFPGLLDLLLNHARADLDHKPEGAFAEHL